MNRNNLSETISAYLKQYADSPVRRGHNPSAKFVQALRANPSEAFDLIGAGAFEKPENLDPKDLDAPLFPMLVTFVDLIPELLIPRLTKGFWASRYTYIQCAAASKSPVFVPTLIELLTDRSIYIKTLLLSLITEWPHLQVPAALPKFDKLSSMKSFQDSSTDRELLDKARRAVAAKA